MPKRRWAGSTGEKLVIGASGFLGSHVTRQLVESGAGVRVMLRRTSSTKGIDDLDVERCYGDVFDDDALRAAMSGCDVVYYCVVDARMWLRDPAPLFRTNVEGLRHVLDAALDADLKKFVFTSTTGALAISDTKVVTEDDPHNWEEGGAYIEARVAAEKMVLAYALDKGLPAVAMCISTTYGPRLGADAARLAARSRRHRALPVLLRLFVRSGGHRRRRQRDASRRREWPRRRTLHHLRQVHEHPRAARNRRDSCRQATTAHRHPDVGDECRRARQRPVGKAAAPRPAVRPRRHADGGTDVPLDHGKAERELGWTPEPVEESIRKAAVWFASRG